MILDVVICDECKHQIKQFVNDKRYKESGFFTYHCGLNSDQFENHAVDGFPREYCSSGERKGEGDDT